MEKRWYAFTDAEDIVLLGRHANFDGAHAADEKLPFSSVWIFDEDSLSHLHDKIRAALDAQIRGET